MYMYSPMTKEALEIAERVFGSSDNKLIWYKGEPIGHIMTFNGCRMENTYSKERNMSIVITSLTELLFCENPEKKELYNTLFNSTKEFNVKNNASEVCPLNYFIEWYNGVFTLVEWTDANLNDTRRRITKFVKEYNSKLECLEKQAKREAEGMFKNISDSVFFLSLS